jgi:hypothetical protein
VVPASDAVVSVLVGLLAETVASAIALAEEEGLASTILSQLRSNRGVVESLLPTMPKLGLGVSGAASWRVYHLHARVSTYRFRSEE